MIPLYEELYEQLNNGANVHPTLAPFFRDPPRSKRPFQCSEIA